MAGNEISDGLLRQIYDVIRFVRQQRRNGGGLRQGRMPTQVFSSTGTRRFELKTALTPSSSTTAHPLEWDDTTSSYVADTTAANEFTVYDMAGIFRSPAGAQGYANFRNDAKRWEIIECQRQATHILCAADGAVAEVDATFSVDTVTIALPVGGILPSGGITVVTNTFSFTLDDDADVYAIWNEATEVYVAIQGDCP